MAREIERKFLPKDHRWRTLATSHTRIQQGYLCGSAAAVVRVRLTDSAAFLTIKGPTTGASRDEFEYAIPPADAHHMIEHLCETVLEKTRHYVPHSGMRWEVDEFHGRHQGLVVAELELPSEDAPFDRPEWLGKEVTADPRYSNAALAAAGVIPADIP